jgi:hypothetical protein
MIRPYLDRGRDARNHGSANRTGWNDHMRSDRQIHIGGTRVD